MADNAAVRIREEQRRWALNRKLVVGSGGYCRQINDNLFQPLSASARSEFESGDGMEFGRPWKRSKLQALHSSAALACNVFDYWRGHGLTVLQTALGVGGPFSELAFERKFPGKITDSLHRFFDREVALMASGLDIKSRFGHGLLKIMSHPASWKSNPAALAIR